MFMGAWMGNGSCGCAEQAALSGDGFWKHPRSPRGLWCRAASSRGQGNLRGGLPQFSCPLPTSLHFVPQEESIVAGIFGRRLSPPWAETTTWQAGPCSRCGPRPQSRPAQLPGESLGLAFSWREWPPQSARHSWGGLCPCRACAGDAGRAVPPWGKFKGQALQSSWRGWLRLCRGCTAAHISKTSCARNSSPSFPGP